MEILVNFAVTCTTAVFAAIVASRQYWHQKKADLEAEYSSRFNTKKWEVYTEFIKFVPQIIGNELPDTKPSTDLIAVDSLASQIVLAGSDRVVTAFRLWRETARVYGQSNQLTKAKLFNLIAEMRRDLGNKYTRLEMDDLLGALESGS